MTPPASATFRLSKQTTVAISVLFIALSFFFYQTLLSAAEIWAVSEIFNHCFLVVPGSLYLIYRKRDQLINAQLAPNLWVLVLLVPLIFVQVFGAIGQIQLFTHFALFASLPLIIVACIGFRAALVIPFPLFFMLLAIPVGEQLIPWLQAITADMAVFLLHLTQIPVYRNGLYIDIPSGKFLVAEACSGISFFISSIAFGSLYAHLSYQTNKAKILFFIFAAAVPIFANALRVYGIIMIAHWSDMKYAVGADHLIYGWFFYALVLIIIFLVGERFRNVNSEQQACYTLHPSWNIQSKLNSVLVVLILVIFISGAWQFSMLSGLLNKPANNLTEFKINEYQYKKDEKWGIKFDNADKEIFLTKNGIQFHIAIYHPNNRVGELVSSLNQFYTQDNWSLVGKLEKPNTANWDYNLYQITTGLGLKRSIAQWYQFHQFQTESALKAKLYDTYLKTLNQADIAYSITCSSLDVMNTEQLLSACKTLSKEIDTLLNMDGTN
ncbi:exosortase A [Catenovulum sp. SM1970]|uniref:exosortase A n=1 Tax=Marinifaba aquimaris TaxID=2741323 RepID=UPI001572E8C6|nr:exosortase A [Marinifaba aquimaris]NTS75954.1 exosortase A [Marinifaba aquimaris]